MPLHCIRNRRVGRHVLPRVVLGAALAALLVGINAAPVRAGDDDEDGASVMSRIMHTFGLRNADETVMGRSDAYGERSPLVVPPTRDLPPPVSETAPPVPNWPRDPDVAERQKAKKIDNKASYRRYDTVTESARALRPDELNQRSKSANPGDADSTADSQMVDPRDQGAKKSLFSGLTHIFNKNEAGTFTGEPARTSLTDPPVGYLTPSPDQPYGVGQTTPTTNKVKSLAERVEAPR
jgi:hypothetical protein